MATEQMHISKSDASVKQIARKLAHKMRVRTGEPVGSSILAAAVAKVMGAEQAGPLLKASGIDNPRQFLDAIPFCTEAEAQEFAPLYPNTELSLLLRGELAGFLEGHVALEKALQVLLKSSKNDLLDFAESLIRTARKGGASSVCSSTKDLIRHLAMIYQPRYDLCYKHYYGVDRDTHGCDFLSNQKHKQFLEKVDQLYQNENETCFKVLGSSVYDSSPLGHCARKYGDLEADILGITFLGELGLVGQGPLNVRGIGWSLDPKNFHRILGLVKMKVQKLADENILAIYPDDGDVRLQSHVLTSNVVMDEFLNYLRDADPLTEQDHDDILRRI